MSLSDVVKPGLPKERPPLWKGPEEDGITFSMLSRFLTCRERFRVHVVEGLRPAPQFNHRIEYGQMWHSCEEALAGGKPWINALADYCRKLAQEHPFSQEQISHWYDVCRVQFPVYEAYWKAKPGPEKVTPLVQEQVFDVPYKLPSGRTVRLRGKWDSVDVVESGRVNGIYLQENKTKGDVDEVALRRQLTFDLQTMLYLVALEWDYEWSETSKYPALTPIRGVRYNVVRRPLAGGKGSIRQHKTEKRDDFYARLGGLIQEDPAYYFFRWTVPVSPADITRFRERCLDPLLEQVCDWWEWISHCLKMGVSHFTAVDDVPGYVELKKHRSNTHFQHPFGVRNILDEGGHTDLDAYLETGSTAGLVRAERLFEELKTEDK